MEEMMERKLGFGTKQVEKNRILNMFYFSLIVRVLIMLVLFQFVPACTKDNDTSRSANIAKIIQQAEAGDAAAQYHLARMYEVGKETAIDQVKASYWYLKAAQQGMIMAQVKIGVRLIEGDGIKKNVDVGIQWLQRAANKNDGVAQTVLAGTYLGEFKSGLNDVEKAFHWMLLAAKNGVAPAEFELSRMYIRGVGTEVNYKQGVYWLRKAAEGGSIPAMRVLSGAYSKPLFGLQQDHDKAKYWLEKSKNDSNQKGE